MIRAMEGLARLAAEHGDPDRAATLFGAAAARRDTVPWPVAPAEVRSYEAAISAVRQALGHSSFDVAWQRGLAMPGDDAVRFAREPATRADTIDATVRDTREGRTVAPE